MLVTSTSCTPPVSVRLGKFGDDYHDIVRMRSQPKCCCYFEQAEKPAVDVEEALRQTLLASKLNRSKTQEL